MVVVWCCSIIAVPRIRMHSLLDLTLTVPKSLTGSYLDVRSRRSIYLPRAHRFCHFRRITFAFATRCNKRVMPDNPPQSLRRHLQPVDYCPEGCMIISYRHRGGYISCSLQSISMQQCRLTLNIPCATTSLLTNPKWSSSLIRHA